MLLRVEYILSTIRRRIIVNVDADRLAEENKHNPEVLDAIEAILRGTYFVRIHSGDIAAISA